MSRSDGCCHTCTGEAGQGEASEAARAPHHHPYRGVGCGVAGRRGSDPGVAVGQRAVAPRQSRRTPAGHRTRHPHTVCIRLSNAEMAQLSAVAEAAGLYPSTWAALTLAGCLESSPHNSAHTRARCHPPILKGDLND